MSLAAHLAPAVAPSWHRWCHGADGPGRPGRHGSGLTALRLVHPVYLTRFGRPLGEVFANRQGVLFTPDDSTGLEVCEAGYCIT